VGQQGYSCASECTRDAGENPRSDAVATRLSGRRFPGERDAASSALSHRIVVGLGPCGENQFGGSNNAKCRLRF
jgi:hypothetical protein